MSVAVIPPPFEETEPTEAPIIAPPFDQTDPVEAPIVPPPFEDTVENVEPAKPDGSEIKAERSPLDKLKAGDFGGAAKDSYETLRRQVSGLIGPTEAERIEQSVQWGTDEHGQPKFEYKPLGDRIAREQGLMTPFLKIDPMRPQSGDTTVDALGKATFNNAAALEGSILSPAGVMLPSGSKAAPLAGRIVAGAFSVDMLSHFKESMDRALNAKTAQEKYEGWLGALSALGFGYAAGTHAAGRDLNLRPSEGGGDAKGRLTVSPEGAAHLESVGLPKTAEALQTSDIIEKVEAPETPPPAPQPAPIDQLGVMLKKWQRLPDSPEKSALWERIQAMDEGAPPVAEPPKAPPIEETLPVEAPDASGTPPETSAPVAESIELPGGAVQTPLNADVMEIPEGSTGYKVKSGSTTATVTESPDVIYVHDIINPDKNGMGIRPVIKGLASKGKPVELHVGRRPGDTAPGLLKRFYTGLGFEDVPDSPGKMRLTPAKAEGAAEIAPPAVEAKPAELPRLADDIDNIVSDYVGEHGSVEDAAMALHDRMESGAPHTPDEVRRMKGALRRMENVLEGEARREAMAQTDEEQGGKHELLRSVRELGGLPLLSEYGKYATGELKRIMEAKKGAFLTLFRRGAKSLDHLRELLNGRGFNFETPYDMLSSIEDSLASGRKVFGEYSHEPDQMPMGPGKMTVGELPPQRETGLKKATVKDERIQRGLDDLPPEARQPEETRIVQAEDVVDRDPTAAPSLVARIVDDGNHALSPDDAALLLVERTHLMNEREMWQDRMTAEDSTPDLFEEAAVKLDDIESQLDRLDQAQRLSGSNWGRVGHLYQRMMKADFSLAAMERRARAAKGGRLSEGESVKIVEQAKQIEELQTKLETVEGARAEAQAKADLTAVYEATVKDLQEKLATQEGRRPIDKRIMAQAEKIVQGFEARGKDAAKRLREKLGMRANVGLDPTIVLDLAEVIAAKVARFSLDLAKTTSALVAEFGEDIRPYITKAWIKAQKLISGKKTRASKAVEGGAAKVAPIKGERTVADAASAAKAEAVAGEPLSHGVVYDLIRALVASGVHGEDAVMGAAHKALEPLFPGLTERDVRRAFTNYGKARFPSQDAILREVRELQTLTRLQESITREKEGLPALKTGAQRDKATQAVRDKQKELNALLKKRGGPPSPEKIASTNQGRVTALKNHIEDLDRQLRTGEKPPSSGAPMPDSPEVERLKAERDAMKAKLKEIEDAENPPPSPAEQQIESLGKIRERLDDLLSGKRDAAKRPDFNPLSEAANDIQAEILAMRELAAQMRRDAKPKPDLDARREEAKVKTLETAIDRYSQKVREGDFSTAPKMQGPDTAKVAALKEVLASRKSMYEVAKKAGKPVLTPEQRANAGRVKMWERQRAVLEDKIKRGDFTRAKPVKVPLDSAAEKARASLERVKIEFERGVEAMRLKHRSGSAKFWDAFVSLERAMKLTSDVVLAKLSLAAVAREGVLAPVEEAAGGVFTKFIPGLAMRAAREGKFSASAEIQAKAALFTDGMKDAWENLKFRASGLELAHGRRQIRPPAWWEYMGFLHAALKAPVKRAEFTRSLAKRMEWTRSEGRDINDPLVMAELTQEAYVDGQRSIFMQDNVVSQGFNGLLRMAETSKVAPNLGPALARIGRFLVPIVKVPTNIVGEVLTGVHGVPVGTARAVTAYIKGIESLPPAQADAIMRQLKKGAVGASLLLYGYYAHKSIGGFYHDEDHRRKDDVPVGHYRIGGFDLGTEFSHSTGAMLLNIGATVHRVQEERIKGQRRGLGPGVRAAGAGVIEHLPFMPALTGIVDALHDQHGFERYINGLITSTVEPAILQHAAKVADTPGTFPANAFDDANKRRPRDLGETLKAGVPGLREQVPLKK